MHVYQDSSVETEAVIVYPAPLSGGGRIAVIGLGRGVRVHVHTPEEADALIAAAAEAKRLLDPPVITDADGGVMVGPFADDDEPAKAVSA